MRSAARGVRNVDEQTGELKRMFVQDNYSGHKIGLLLLKHPIQLGKDPGYRKKRLDTQGNMRKTQELYRSSGFYKVPAHRFNPLKGTIYLEKVL